MPRFSSRFSFLHWPLEPFSSAVVRTPEDPLLEEHLSKARYSVRMLRYWWAAQAIREEAQRREKRLTIVDYGAGRGWLKRFVGGDVDAKWVALDWKPETELLKRAGYDEILQCNFDHPLPVEAKTADVVSSLHVFEHLPRPAYSLTQIAQILEPGGCLLAGTPTMPDFLARMRQAYFRKRLADGQVMRGGHINSLSPARWETLLQDSGMEPEFVTGSHLVRHTGNPLENSRLWVRLNQLWGALCPSLGSESCLRARRPFTEADVEAWIPQPLEKGKRNHAPGFAVAAGFVVLASVAFFYFNSAREAEAQVHRVLSHQLKTDAAHLLIIHHPLLSAYEDHVKATIVQSIDDVPGALKDLPDGTHVVLHEDHLNCLRPSSDRYVVDSRIDVDDDDFYIIRKDRNGTLLSHFLSE